MTETDAYIHSMVVTNPLMQPVAYSAIRELSLPSSSSGLDAGCGIGLQTLLLAEAVGPTGHVTGFDISPQFLLRAEEIARTSRFSEQIAWRQGDVCDLPFADGTFDWAWSSCCVGYPASVDPLPAVVELARVVKHGGTMALFVWSSEALLPGYPVLESRLSATSAGIAPFINGQRPERHFLRTLGWFREAGLENVRVRTFAGDAHAPLSDDLRKALIALLEMRWPNVQPEITEEDRSEYQRLCLPQSPEYILNQPDYYAFFTCSLFWGTVVH